MSAPRVSEQIPQIPDARIGIIASKWHPECVGPMIERCVAALKKNGATNVDVHYLPGCYELPLAARRLFQKNASLEAVIAFGVIVKGDTDHYEMIRDECMRGFSNVMFEFDKPIVMEVLAVSDIKIAEVRSKDDEKNKGLEAAVAACEIISWRRTV